MRIPKSRALIPTKITIEHLETILEESAVNCDEHDLYGSCKECKRKNVCWRYVSIKQAINALGKGEK